MNHASRRRRALSIGACALTIATLPLVVTGVISPKVAHAAPSVQTSFPIFADEGSGVYDGGGMGPATTIVSGPGGAMWMNQARSSIVKLTPSGTATECVTSGFDGVYWGSSDGYGIAVGSDGNLWATMRQTYVTSSSSSLTSGVIARVTPACAVTYFPTPTSASFPYKITSGPSGYLWFTEKDAGAIGAINTSGVIREFAIPTTSSAPTGIVAGADGNLWFTESASDKIGRMTPAGVFTEFAVTAGAHPNDIAAGPDGELWFSEPGANKIGAISTSGTGYVEYAIPTANSAPTQITTGPDGALWFAENSADQIARITTGGTITEYGSTQVPNFLGGGTRAAAPFGIASGPDGNIWYTDLPGNTPATAVGRLPLVPCGDLTTSVTSSSDGSGVRDTPGSQQSVQINLSNCGAPTLTGATTSTSVTPPSGCPAAPAIGSFTSTLSNGQSTSHTFSFNDPSCLGTYTVTSTTTSGSSTVASTTTYYVVSNGPGSTIVGDFNGDGYQDVAVGDPTAGRVLAYYGGPGGLDSRDPQIFTASTPGMPSQLSACGDCSIGFALVAGNFNGDRYSDLAIGAPDYGYPGFSSGQNGAVVILKGGPAGLTTQSDQFINAPSSLSAGAGFGGSLASGDFNKDGFADLAVASASDVVGGNGWAGALTLMYGSANGVGAAQTVITESTPGMPGPAVAGDDAFGWELDTGDFNRDGYSDLAIATPGKAGDDILYGSSTGLTFSGSQYLQGVGPYTYQLAVGDFKGNGYDDLAVGESCGNVVEIHYGGASGLGSVAFKTAQEIKPTSRGMPAGGSNYFGLRLAAGDIKHNGKQDLIVGDTVRNVVLWGTATKLSTKGAAVVGDSPATLGLADVNGDGSADLLDGSNVYNGSATGLTKTPAYSLPQVAPKTFSISSGHGGGDLLCGGP